MPRKRGENGNYIHNFAFFFGFLQVLMVKKTLNTSYANFKFV